MDARGAPRHQGNRVYFVHRVRWEQLRLREIPVDPGLDRDVLGERRAIDDEHRHFVLGIDTQILGRHVLRLAKIQRADLERGARLGQRDVGHQRAGVGRVVEDQLHSKSPDRSGKTRNDAVTDRLARASRLAACWSTYPPIDAKDIG